MKPLLTLLLVLVCAAVGMAQIYTFEFEGTVSSITNTAPGVSIGQKMTGWFNYDDSVPGVFDTSMGVSNRYNYDQICSVEIRVGDCLFSHLNQTAEIDVDNDQYDLRADRLEDHFFYRFSTYVSQFGSNPISCLIRFDDYSASVYNNYDLPTQFDLADYDGAVFYFYRSIQSFSVTCQIDKISLVPEPASAAIMILGTAWMGLKRKR